jgi:catechol 2,3-dioxygenase-like lactoylglutathione lyase family enzyme
MSRITEIRYVAYGVPDLAAEQRFYGEVWGLRQVAEQDGRYYYATEGSAEHHVVRLRQSPDCRVDVIAMAADTAADVDVLFGRVTGAGCRIIFAPCALTEPGGGYGFRFFSPDGLPFEISADVARGSSRELQRWEGIPQKISHIVLHTPNPKAAVQFCCDVLGFRLSDWLGDFMAFLRCNEWHHRLAFLPGPPCLNHVAYDMLGVDDMMRGISRLKQLDVNIVWGPGRHTAGNNTFSYFTTPNHCAVEYTADLEQVDEATWQATVHTPAPRVMDQWGVGVGGPQTMPHAVPDPGLFQPSEV